jgi:hypothetical protein
VPPKAHPEDGPVPQAPAPSAETPAVCPDFGYWYAVRTEQIKTNFYVAVGLLGLLGLMLVQDREIQALAKAVRALQP